MPARRTSANGSGSLLPTASVCGNWNRRGASKHSGDGLATYLANGLLPTPRATDGDRGGRGDLIQAMRGNASPSGHFALLPTPTAMEYGSNQGGAAGRTGLVRRGLRHGIGGTVALLTLVEWMMGFPPRWLIDAALAVPVSPPVATRSSRKSRKQS